MSHKYADDLLDIVNDIPLTANQREDMRDLIYLIKSHLVRLDDYDRHTKKLGSFIQKYNIGIPNQHYIDCAYLFMERTLAEKEIQRTGDEVT